MKYAVVVKISQEYIARFLRRYVLRWESPEECGIEKTLALNMSSIVTSWDLRIAAWAHDCEKFGGIPGSFWAQVERSQKKKTLFNVQHTANLAL